MKPDTMKSLKKALVILNLFVESQNELSLGEIIKFSGLSKSTAMRIISVLTEYEYLKQKERRGKYTLGMIHWRFHKVISSKMQIRNVAFPYLIKLSQQLNEVTALAINNGIEDMLTETFSNTFRKNDLLTVLSDQGVMRLPLHCTSLGKIILANMPVEELSLFFEIKKLERLTPGTITDPEVIKNQLIKIRKEGIATDYEEYSIGVRSIGTAIRDGIGRVVGSIGVVAPSARLPSTRIKQLVPEIKNCAAEISKGLGFDENVRSKGA